MGSTGTPDNCWLKQGFPANFPIRKPSEPVTSTHHRSHSQYWLPTTSYHHAGCCDDCDMPYFPSERLVLALAPNYQPLPSIVVHESRMNGIEWFFCHHVVSNALHSKINYLMTSITIVSVLMPNNCRSAYHLCSFTDHYSIHCLSHNSRMRMPQTASQFDPLNDSMLTRTGI